MAKHPTLQRFHCIFAGFFVTFVLGGLVIGIATLSHALLFQAIKWKGSRTSYLWLVVFIFESLTTYWLINSENDYTESRHGIYDGIEMTRYFKHTWDRVFATLFFMLLVLVGSWVFNIAVEENRLQVPFWIQILIPWLLFLYTEIVRVTHKGQLDKEQAYEQSQTTRNR